MPQVFVATEEALSHVPENYEKLVEGRSVQVIKNTLFSRKTHEQTCGNLDPISSATTVLQNSVRNFGNLMSSGQLAGIKAHEQKARLLRTYGATVHLLNLILHKFANKAPREKSAMSRESLDCIAAQPSFFCCVCVGERQSISSPFKPPNVQIPGLSERG